MPGNKGRSPDAFALGRGSSASGAEKRRWTDPESTQTGSQALAVIRSTSARSSGVSIQPPAATLA